MLRTGPGLLCSVCGGDRLDVKDSRAGPDCIRRRRQCPCGAPRITTIETISADVGQGRNRRIVHDAAEALLRLSPKKRILVMHLIRVMEGTDAPNEAAYLGLENEL
jgi:hypothetical protein